MRRRLFAAWLRDTTLSGPRTTSTGSVADWQRPSTYFQLLTPLYFRETITLSGPGNVKLIRRESQRSCEHSVQLGKRIRVPGRRRSQHVHAERGRIRGAHTIFVGNELQSDHSPILRKRGIHPSKQCSDHRRIEVVEEAGEKNNVIAAAANSFWNALPGIVWKRDDTPAARAFSSATARTDGQSSAKISAFGFSFAIVTPNIP